MCGVAPGVINVPSTARIETLHFMFLRFESGMFGVMGVNRGLAKLEEECSGRPYRHIPPAKMLDSPRQRLKLRDDHSF